MTTEHTEIVISIEGLGERTPQLKDLRKKN
jgi:hypothetical protein